MFLKKTLLLTCICVTLPYHLFAESINLDTLSGSWHLRIMDGMEVRKARAILDFDAKKMLLSGFDGCNRITGTLKKSPNQIYSAHLISTRMACREHIHNYVSKRLHETVSEGFNIKEDKKHGVEGITIKSAKHELFFKQMTKESKWF